MHNWTDFSISEPFNHFHSFRLCLYSFLLRLQTLHKNFQEIEEKMQHALDKSFGLFFDYVCSVMWIHSIHICWTMENLSLSIVKKSHPDYYQKETGKKLWLLCDHFKYFLRLWKTKSIHKNWNWIFRLGNVSVFISVSHTLTLIWVLVPSTHYAVYGQYSICL